MLKLVDANNSRNKVSCIMHVPAKHHNIKLYSIEENNYIQAKQISAWKYTRLLCGLDCPGTYTPLQAPMAPDEYVPKLRKWLLMLLHEIKQSNLLRYPWNEELVWSLEQYGPPCLTWPCSEQLLTARNGPFSQILPHTVAAGIDSKIEDSRGYKPFFSKKMIFSFSTCYVAWPIS